MNSSSARFIRLFDRFARFLSAVGAVAAGLILLAMSLHILAEIVLRTLFLRSTFVLEEMIGYGVAAMSFLGLGYALNTGALIRMNLVLEKLGDGLVRRIVEVICIISAGIFTGIAAWYFYVNAVRDFMRGHVSETLSETPLWLPPSIMLLGMLVFLVQLLAYLLRVLAGDVSFAPSGREQE
ncbi:MAG: TRAP transporter small permease [Rhodobacteraceae bacterium]|nr:TRAP transporter small permease [Paracoccaceae bacterium]MCY4139739.1 TRAP transporter small permease [Paracoccaceae bacterium]